MTTDLTTELGPANPYVVRVAGRRGFTAHGSRDEAITAATQQLLAKTVRRRTALAAQARRVVDAGEVWVAGNPDTVTVRRLKRKPLKWNSAELEQLDAMLGRLRAKAAAGGLKPARRSQG